MALKPFSDGLAAVGQVSPRLSFHGGEKESIGARSNTFSRLANMPGNKDKGIQRQEFQRPSTGNARSRRSSGRERILNLEQDIDRLRKTLRHQEDVHRALERAFTRPLGVLPRLPSFLPQKTKQLLAEVALLEEEVVCLEEQIVRLRQCMYQNEEHAPSTTKQKEPLGNAEQLKAKRILRRSPSSGNLSDYVRKQGKQDSFVGSMLYSMKGSSPDRNLRTPNRVPKTHNRSLETGGLHRRQLSMGSIPDTQGLFFVSQAMNGSLSIYKGLEETKALELSTEHRKSRIPLTSHEKENQSHLKAKNLHNLPPVPKGKTGAQKQASLIRTALMETQPPTPKRKTEHTLVNTHFGPTKLPSLNIFEEGKSTQPNKLSEEIVKCLMSIFLKLTRPSLATNKETSSTVSRLTFSRSKSYGSRSPLSRKIPTDCSEEMHFKDPYGVCSESILRDIGPYKHFHDITAHSFDLGRLPSCASLFRRLRFLVSKLCSADVKGLTYQQKLAFWINIYNACMMHAFLEHGIPGTPQKVVSVMRKTEHTLVNTHFGPTKLPSLNIFEEGKSTQPNKLSEEIVKCLMSIFLKLTRPSLATNKETSSTVSRLTFSRSKSYGSRSPLSRKIPTECSEEMHFKDPYGVCSESILRDIGPYKHFHDITAHSFDLGRLPSCASLFRRLRFLVRKLCSADVKGLTYQQKLAFWINIYNACMMHAFLEHGIPGTPQKVVSVMRKAYWKNGKSDEEAMMRAVYGLECSEPLITFALCCGSWSSPAVRVYTSNKVETELEAAKREYLLAAIGVTAERKVLIPKLLDWYMWDFAKDKKSLLEWICEQLPISSRATVEECLKGKTDECVSQSLHGRCKFS